MEKPFHVYELLPQGSDLWARPVAGAGTLGGSVFSGLR